MLPEWGPPWVLVKSLRLLAALSDPSAPEEMACDRTTQFAAPRAAPSSGEVLLETAIGGLNSVR